MRITIDTEKERIIVPDTFFTQLDKMNKIRKDAGGDAIEPEDFVKQSFEKAMQNTIIRPGDKVVK